MSESALLLHTERLELTPFAAEDAEALHGVFVDPEVRRYLLDDRVVDREWVDAEIASSAERFAGGSLGLWSVRRRDGDGEAGELVGFVGFREFFDPPQLQLIYGLVPSAWGQGLATEAAAEAIRYGFEEGGLSEVIAATDAPNVASERVMQRLDMKFLEQARLRGQATVFYRLRAPNGS